MVSSHQNRRVSSERLRSAWPRMKGKGSSRDPCPKKPVSNRARCMNPRVSLPNPMAKALTPGTGARWMSAKTSSTSKHNVLRLPHGTSRINWQMRVKATDLNLQHHVKPFKVDALPEKNTQRTKSVRKERCKKNKSKERATWKTSKAPLNLVKDLVDKVAHQDHKCHERQQTPNAMEPAKQIDPNESKNTSGISPQSVVFSTVTVTILRNILRSFDISKKFAHDPGL